MLRLNSVAVVVKDAARSAKWYQEKLGLEVRDKEGHWVTVGSKEGAVLHLCEGDKLEPGNTGILFLSKDLEKDAKALEKKGVKFTQPVTKESWGTFAMFSDPDGNEFWLMPE